MKEGEKQRERMEGREGEGREGKGQAGRTERGKKEERMDRWMDG